MFASAAFSYDGDTPSEYTREAGEICNGYDHFHGHDLLPFDKLRAGVGAHYEVMDGVVTKYYYAGSQRIAMRTDGALSFILGDHLGSTSLTTDASGVVLGQQYYTAWGETRYSSGAEQTKYGYTGQYSYASDFGLLFYNARWYDSALGRFAQADTIVPGGVQELDRYAYGLNNPLRFTDPTGHLPCRYYAGNGCTPDASSYQEPYNYAPAGNQIQINIMAGITLPAKGLDGNTQTVGFLYYSFSVVTDNKGNLQFYVTLLDQEYIEGSKSPTHMGGFQTVPPIGVEKNKDDSAYGLGLSVGWGWIDGEKFRKEGTTAYAGKAEDAFLGVDVVSGDVYSGLDKYGNPSTDLVGMDVAGSIGVPVSMGDVIVNSVPINRNPLQIPPMFIPLCQGIGMCGSTKFPGSQLYPP